MKNDDPPLHYILALGLSLLLGVVLLHVVDAVPNKGMDVSVPPSGGLYLRQISPPFIVEEVPLASLAKTSPLMWRIIKCESNFNPYAKNPHSSAFGYCQMIRKTRLWVQKKMGKKINWYSPQEQLEACQWLLDHSGTQHWNKSRRCWER